MDVRHYIIEKVIIPNIHKLSQILKSREHILRDENISFDQKIDELNSAFEHENIEFVDAHDQHHWSIAVLRNDGTDLRDSVPLSRRDPRGSGIVTAMTFPEHQARIVIYYDESGLQHNIETNIDNFVRDLEHYLEHELIHREQVQKLNPDFDKSKFSSTHGKSYYGNPTEIPAYARNMISELQDEGLDKDDILDFLRKVNIKAENIDRMNQHAQFLDSDMDPSEENDFWNELFRQAQALSLSKTYSAYFTNLRSEDPKGFHKFLTKAYEYASSL